MFCEFPGSGKIGVTDEQCDHACINVCVCVCMAVYKSICVCVCAWMCDVCMCVCGGGVYMCTDRYISVFVDTVYVCL